MGVPWPSGGPNVQGRCPIAFDVLTVVYRVDHNVGSIAKRLAKLMTHFHFWNINRDGRDRASYRSLAYTFRQSAHRAAVTHEPDKGYRLCVKPCSREGCRYAPAVRRA